MHYEPGSFGTVQDRAALILRDAGASSAWPVYYQVVRGGDAPGVLAVEVEAGTGMPRRTVMRALAKLVELGVVERRQCEEDGRRSRYVVARLEAGRMRDEWRQVDASSRPPHDAVGATVGTNHDSVGATSGTNTARLPYREKPDSGNLEVPTPEKRSSRSREATAAGGGVRSRGASGNLELHPGIVRDVRRDDGLLTVWLKCDPGDAVRARLRELGFAYSVDDRAWHVVEPAETALRFLGDLVPAEREPGVLELPAAVTGPAPVDDVGEVEPLRLHGEVPRWLARWRASVVAALAGTPRAGLSLDADVRLDGGGLAVVFRRELDALVAEQELLALLSAELGGHCPGVPVRVEAAPQAREASA